MADVPQPPPLNRTFSNGGIPIYRGSDITIIQRPFRKFRGNQSDDRPWFGAVQFKINGEAWELQGFLNGGAEGQTYSAIHKSSSKQFALKFIDDPTSREVELVKAFPRKLVGHPNLVKYKMLVLNCHCQFPYAKDIIFMEMVANGELFDFVASAEHSVAKKPISEGTSRRFLHDVIAGMAECYRYGLTHRDLKPENLLLNEEGRLVIVDMGHAKIAPVPSQGGVPSPLPLLKATTTNKYGTPAFNAPESVKGEQYDCEASDMWAVGVTAFILHSKLPAFKEGGGVATWSDISGANNEVFWQKIAKSKSYPEFPDELRHFINSIWRINPTERPSFGQLELAISGDAEILSQFPGLRWLAQPTNDVDTFAAELRQYLPKIVLSIGKPTSEHVQANSSPRRGSWWGDWLKRCSWCGV